MTVGSMYLMGPIALFRERRHVDRFTPTNGHVRPRSARPSRATFRHGSLASSPRWQRPGLVSSMLSQMRFGSHQIPGMSRHRTRAA